MLPPDPQTQIVLSIAVLAAVVGVVGLVAAFVALRRAARLQDHYALLMRDVDGNDVAAALADYVRRQQAAETRLQAAETQIGSVDRRLGLALQRVSVLRYKAFEDAGGDQSFTVALLDAGSNGVVFSGLHSRAGIRVYAKPVTAGRSAYALTTEEERAVETAGQADANGQPTG
jgi:hypothetical protein